ncbi:hypothetical protein AB0957_30600, partial [Streptomyces zhihengii]
MITSRLRRRAAVVALSLSALLAPAAASASAGAAPAPAAAPAAARAVPAAAAAACPVVTDRLHAAADRRVDVGRITPEPAYRSTCGQLYRADGRGPEIVFEQGFHPKAP